MIKNGQKYLKQKSPKEDSSHLKTVNQKQEKHLSPVDKSRLLPYWQLSGFFNFFKEIMTDSRLNYWWRNVNKKFTKLPICLD
jgi:hypothetical protein